MGTLWCTLFHWQIITGEGWRQEGGGGTVLSMTSSSSLSPWEEQWFLPLNSLQHFTAGNTAERCLARKDEGRNTLTSTERTTPRKLLSTQCTALENYLLSKWMTVKVNAVLMKSILYVNYTAEPSRRWDYSECHCSERQMCKATETAEVKVSW